MAEDASKWFVAVMFAASVACSATAGPNSAQKKAPARDAAVQDARANVSDLPRAPTGTGMQIVPIHRLDAAADQDDAQRADPDAGFSAGSAGGAMSTGSAGAAGLATEAGLPDAMPANAASAAAGSGGSAAPLPAPIHRYDFSGSAAVITDSVAGADGVMFGDARPHDGTLVLDGVNDYIQLPRQLLSSLRDVTLLVWLEWQGGDCWQRVFDFGLRHTNESGVIVVDSSLFITIQGCPAKTVMIGARMGDQEERVEATMPTPSDTLLQVGLVVDTTARKLRLVIDGRVVAERDTELQLSALRDEYALVGRSLFDHDPLLHAVLHEFRIYDRTLDAYTLQRTAAAGPDFP